MSDEKPKNRIQEYFSDTEAKLGNELFRIDESNVDIKTEVSDEELRLVNVLMMNDKFFERKGLKTVYSNYYAEFLRLKVSLDRKGRREYVDIHRKDNSDDTIQKIGNLNNVLGVRK